MRTYGSRSPMMKDLCAAVTLWTRTEVVLGSKHDRDTSYPVKGFSWCSSLPPGKCRHITSARPIPFPSKSFPDHHLPIILPFDTMQSRYRQHSKIINKETVRNIFEDASPSHSYISRYVIARKLLDSILNVGWESTTIRRFPSTPRIFLPWAWRHAALCYKPEDRGFESQWGHWIFQLT
jgi:hypothetical protein